MKTCLITGATAGIGAASARAFVGAGWRVIGTGRREERLQALQEELGSAFLPLSVDMQDVGALEDLAKLEGEWSAVSWEYASIMDLWSDAATKAGTADPEAVLTAMKAGGKGKHIFGEAEWWGKDLFGIDNALVGNWPVVVIKDGKARIQQYKSIPDWWAKNKDLMIKHMTALNQMYFQRK